MWCYNFSSKNLSCFFVKENSFFRLTIGLEISVDVIKKVCARMNDAIENEIQLFVYRLVSIYMYMCSFDLLFVFVYLIFLFFLFKYSCQTKMIRWKYTYMSMITSTLITQNFNFSRNYCLTS